MNRDADRLTDSTPRGGLILALTALLICSSLAAGLAFAEPLTVRVNDAVAPPGGTVAMVLRTYASRPIGQGQLCLQAAPTIPQATTPVASVLGAQVFSDIPDVSSSVIEHLTVVPQVVVLEFTSPSITVNASDGPMAVVFMQLSPDVQPGETYELVLDLANTTLIDGGGLPIDVTPRNGTLTIRAPTAPRGVSASAEDVVPGDDALLGFETNELYLISSGQIGLRYDVSLTTGAPVVSMSPLHGNATFVADTSTPGLVIVDFSSPDGTLNSIPGNLIEVRVPTSSAVPVGTTSPVTLDPALTWLFDTGGQPLPLEFDSDLLEFVAPVVPAPGVVSGLALGLAASGELFLDWQPDCGSGTSFALYRGDLAQGYGSLAIEPGFCTVAATSATIPLGPGDADFFLIVPIFDGFEGGYGFQSPAESRPPATTTCNPQGLTHDCLD